MSEQASGPDPLFEAVSAQPEMSGLPPANVVASVNDLRLVEALRRGEEAAFQELLDRHHLALVRLASMYVSSQAVAEEVVQETWLAVLQGIHGFEGRASLKTWIFRILINKSKKHGQREDRQIPFSALWQPDDEAAEPAVEPERFRPPDAPQWPGHWATHPTSWENIPENRLLSQETQTHLLQAIDGLPPAQREVMTLRDLSGWTAEEVCRLLDLSEVNQRVLLHRARSKVRRALEQYFEQ